MVWNWKRRDHFLLVFWTAWKANFQRARDISHHKNYVDREKDEDYMKKKQHIFGLKFAFNNGKAETTVFLLFLVVFFSINNNKCILIHKTKPNPLRRNKSWIIQLQKPPLIRMMPWFTFMQPYFKVWPRTSRACPLERVRLECLAQGQLFNMLREKKVFLIHLLHPHAFYTPTPTAPLKSGSWKYVHKMYEKKSLKRYHCAF